MEDELDEEALAEPECEGETVDEHVDEPVCVSLGVTLTDELGELERLVDPDELPE
jgi:hypothetical protein